jgi:rubrerythrin
MTMEIFAYTIELKKEKEAFYRQLSHDATYEGVRELFGLLANEEARHREAIEEMEDSVNIKLDPTTIKKDAKQAFKKIQNELDIQEKEVPPFNDRTLKLYEKALQYEKKAEALFMQKAKEATDSCQQEMFRKIATDEREHKAVIQALIDFVSKPERWLENAEWYHLEEY